MILILVLVVSLIFIHGIDFDCFCSGVDFDCFCSDIDFGGGFD